MQEQSTSFGMRLRQIRKSMGMTQREFAEILGTSKQVISRYEIGKRIPKVTIVKEFSLRLGVSIADIIGESE